MSRRNLVPMPTQPRRRPTQRRPTEKPAPASLAPLETWQCFAFLIVTAIVYYYAGMLILIIAAFVVFFKAWFWLCVRYPRTISAILAALLDRRRW